MMEEYIRDLLKRRGRSPELFSDLRKLIDMLEAEAAADIEPEAPAIEAIPAAPAIGVEPVEPTIPPPPADEEEPGDRVVISDGIPDFLDRRAQPASAEKGAEAAA
jgi:hypothetical protein